MSHEQIRINKIDPIFQGIKDRNESYLSTIHALHGFILAVTMNSVSKSSNIKSSIGRRMHFADQKEKRNFCTPDLVVQLENTQGIVGEAKLLVCKNIDDHWKKYINQMKKYDNDLVGWWTNNELITEANLVLITELSFSSQISEYFQEKINHAEVVFSRPLSIIEFSTHQKSREYLFLRTRLGTLPGNLEQTFKNGIDIPLETLVFENKEKKFYDAKPQDIEYIMEILWQNIFNQEAVTNSSGKVEFIENEKTWRIPIEQKELTETIQKLYGSVSTQKRDVEYPQESWIKEALEKFVSIGYAEKGKNNKEYIILFKKISRPMEKFVQMLHKKRGKSVTSSQQMELFLNLETKNLEDNLDISE